MELNEFCDVQQAEQRFLKSSAAGTSIETLYNREWAGAVLERSLKALLADYAKRGWQARYDLLIPPLPPELAAKDTVTNSLGMKFLPVTICGGPTDKQRVLFSLWETRVQDCQVFATETKREWRKPFFDQGPDHPAVNVSWEEANAFCAWLTERERKAGKIPADQSYRLPGDQEWNCVAGIDELEDVARAAGRAITIYPWEKPPGQWVSQSNAWGTPLPTPPDHVANYRSAEIAPLLGKGDSPFLNAGMPPRHRDGHATTAPVGSYPPNHLGLYDVSGNVWELNGDVHPSEKWLALRMIRGGSWLESGYYALALTRRDAIQPDTRREDYGFRVVLASTLKGSVPALAPPPP